MNFIEHKNTTMMDKLIDSELATNVSSKAIFFMNGLGKYVRYFFNGASILATFIYAACVTLFTKNDMKLIREPTIKLALWINVGISVVVVVYGAHAYFGVFPSFRYMVILFVLFLAWQFVRFLIFVGSEIEQTEETSRGRRVITRPSY